MTNEFWEPLLGENHCASYDSAVDLDVLNVLGELYKARKNDEAIFYTKISKNLNMAETHVELIQFILCGADFAEYGTSPRGCWLTDKGIKFYEQNKKYHAELME